MIARQQYPEQLIVAGHRRERLAQGSGARRLCVEGVAGQEDGARIVLTRLRREPPDDLVPGFAQPSAQLFGQLPKRLPICRSELWTKRNTGLDTRICGWRRRLRQRVAAVRPPSTTISVAGDVARLVGGEEQRRVRDVPGVAHAAHRHLRVARRRRSPRNRRRRICRRGGRTSGVCMSPGTTQLSRTPFGGVDHRRRARELDQRRPWRRVADLRLADVAQAGDRGRR